MRIYPAIDILGGKAVRLKQGRADDVTVYGDPMAMAARWRSAGAEWLHIVDLDGAFGGEPANLEIVRTIAAANPDLKIQAGGGIRSIQAVESMLQAGVHRVVLGTAAVQDQDFVRQALAAYRERIAVGIDARDGRVRVAGWTLDSNVTAIELSRRLEEIGARIVIYTDIARDGVLQGPNIESTLQLIRNTSLLVIASGGVSVIEDVRALSQLNESRLEGVIVGKALYENRFQLEEALTYAR
jgi:phosphoribosylformimino-5-aminoimidazole carboxamide ribotide isomerase